MGQTNSSNQPYELQLLQSLPQTPPIPTCQFCTNCPAYQPMSLMGLRWEPSCETFPGLEKFQRMNRFGRRNSIGRCVGIVVHPQGDPRPRTEVWIVGRDTALDGGAEVRNLATLEKRGEVVSVVPQLVPRWEMESGDIERGDLEKRSWKQVHRSWEEYVVVMGKRPGMEVREWEVESELQMWKAVERSKETFGGLRCGRGGVRRWEVETW